MGEVILLTGGGESLLCFLFLLRLDVLSRMLEAEEEFTIDLELRRRYWDSLENMSAGSSSLTRGVDTSSSSPRFRAVCVCVYVRVCVQYVCVCVWVCVCVSLTDAVAVLCAGVGTSGD